MTMRAPDSMKILNEEWPQKGTKGAKRSIHISLSFFEPFALRRAQGLELVETAPLCGQMPFPSARGRREFSDQNDE
jgi:hypothetical protein